jgi:hypothetical protein
VRTAKLQPVFTAASGAADPDQSKDARGGFIRLRLQQLIAPHARAASGINTVQGKYVLGEIDAEKDHGHGHLLASVGSGLRLSNPIVDPARRHRMRKTSGGWRGGLGMSLSFVSQNTSITNVPS